MTVLIMKASQRLKSSYQVAGTPLNNEQAEAPNPFDEVRFEASLLSINYYLLSNYHLSINIYHLNICSALV